jgi:ADP-heptose:LPS heptosyltransferase
MFRVLVVLCSTGLNDAVNALPAFELIKMRRPGAFVAAGYFKPTQVAPLEMSPHVSALVPLFNGSVKHTGAALKGLRHNVAHMHGYSVVLFLYKRERPAWPTVLAARLAGSRPLYRHQLTAYRKISRAVFNQMVVSRLLNLPDSRFLVPRLQLTVDDERFAGTYLQRHGLGRTPFVVINAHPPGVLSCWGVDKFVRVANALHADGVDVLLNGGVDAQRDGLETLRSSIHPAVHMIDGRDVNVRQLAAIISRCELFIGDVSGPTYLAAALGRPTVSVAGGACRSVVDAPMGRCHLVLPEESASDVCRARALADCGLVRGDRNEHRSARSWRAVKRYARRTSRALFGVPRRQPAKAQCDLPCVTAVTVEHVHELARRQLAHVLKGVSA